MTRIKAKSMLRRASWRPGSVQAWPLLQVAGLSSLSGWLSFILPGNIPKRDELERLESDAGARLEKLEEQNKYLMKRVGMLMDQLGYLTESILRHDVRELHGSQAAKQLYVNSLQSLCSLLLPRDTQAMDRDAELAARQKALAAACGSPESLSTFLDVFMERLRRQGSKGFRLQLDKAEALLRQIIPHMGQTGVGSRGKAVDAAITCLQRLESLAADQRAAAPDCAAEEGALLSDDSSSDSESVLDEGRASFAVSWSRPYFAGMVRYLRASKAGQTRLRAHLLQPDSLGMALLSARAAEELCLQFELDGRGCLKVFPDEAVIAAFELKSSASGLGKGRAQLRSRLRMLMWAARHSGAVPGSVPLVKGRGYLYLPRSAGARSQELLEDGGRLTIIITSL